MSFLFVPLVVGPLVAFCVAASLPRPLGLAVALIGAAVLVASVVGFHTRDAVSDPNAVANGEMRGLGNMIWATWAAATVAAGFAQAVRPALKGRGWAAYPLTASAVFLLAAVVWPSLLDVVF